MEMNGIANMLCIIEMSLQDGKISEETATKLRDQLDTLERYICAVSKSYNEETYVPFWHTVRDNKNLYPNNKGEVVYVQKQSK